MTNYYPIAALLIQMVNLMKCLEWFIWGLCMGMGWAISNNVLNFIGGFMHGSGTH